jgi:hypothetical protein
MPAMATPMRMCKTSVSRSVWRPRNREISSRAALAAAMTSMTTARPAESQAEPVNSAPCRLPSVGRGGLPLPNQVPGPVPDERRPSPLDFPVSHDGERLIVHR